MKVAMAVIGAIALGALLAAGGRITNVTVGPFGVELPSSEKPATVSGQGNPQRSKEPIPNLVTESVPPRSFGSAPESWCLGMRDQWKFRKQNFNEDSESIKKSMEERGCFSYPSVKLE